MIQNWLIVTKIIKTTKGCLSLFKYFIEMGPTLMSPFFVETTFSKQSEIKSKKSAMMVLVTIIQSKMLISKN